MEYRQIYKDFEGSMSASHKRKSRNVRDLIDEALAEASRVILKEKSPTARAVMTMTVVIACIEAAALLMAPTGCGKEFQTLALNAFLLMKSLLTQKKLHKKGAKR